MSDEDVPTSETPPLTAQSQTLDWIDQILEGQRLPATEDETTMSLLVDALRAPGTPEELMGLEAATSDFLAARSTVTTTMADAAPPAATAVGDVGSSTVVGISAASGRARRRGMRSGVAVAAAVASVLLVAGTAAAFTGSLPPFLQRIAEAIGAPAPVEDAPTTPAATTRSPSAVTSAVRARASGTSAVGPGATAGSPGLVGSAAPVTPADQTMPPTTLTPPSGGATPPGQTNRPTTPPGLVGKPTPPGQTNRPTTPPGLVGKPTPPGQTNRPTSAPSPKNTKKQTSASPSATVS